MLAARLCFAWGIPDVIGWLDEVPSRVIDFWIAFDAVEPIGEHWRQTAEVNSRLSQLAGLAALNYGAKLEQETSDECMPQRYVRAKERLPKVESKQIPAAGFDQVAAAFGLSEIVKTHGRINKSS
jgi:hypothetical protein